MRDLPNGTGCFRDCLFCACAPAGRSTREQLEGRFVGGFGLSKLLAGLENDCLLVGAHFRAQPATWFRNFRRARLPYTGSHP
jgi:hypothetical protein